VNVPRTPYRPGVVAELGNGPRTSPGRCPTNKGEPQYGIGLPSQPPPHPRSRINYGTGGASVSYRLGPLTVNSRGWVSLRLGRGLSWRSGR
jgi:hypothetical protein